MVSSDAYLLILLVWWAGEEGQNLAADVLGNVGTVISFRVGAEDAPLLASPFAPAMGPEDLMECPNFHGYMRLHLNDLSARPFSFRNHPDETVRDPASAARLIAASRERWGVPAAECDERATRRAKWIRELG